MPNALSSRVRRYWLAAAPLMVILCTAGLVIAKPATRPLGAVLPASGPATPFRAYVFFQPIDCSGNMEFLRVFARPRFRSHVSVTGMLVPGVTADDKRDATRRFRNLTGSSVVEGASRETRAALRALGYLQTPFVVVLDEQGQVRLATPVPASFEASRTFERQLAELALAPAAKASEP